MKIAVVGIGYVGLANAAVLAQHNEVWAVDIDSDQVDAAEESFFNSEVVADLAEFKQRADGMIANRWSEDLSGVGKGCTRDIYGQD